MRRMPSCAGGHSTPRAPCRTDGMTSERGSRSGISSGRRTCSGTGELSVVVADGCAPVSQLGKERRVMAHHLPALWPAVTVDHGQGHPGQEEGVAARSVAGPPATGYPFMDIGILGLTGAAPPLRGALDGADPLGVAFPIAGRVVAVILPVAAVLALLGLLSFCGSAPSISAKPASPPCGLLPAGGATVLGAESILRPGNEALSAALHKTGTAKGLGFQWGACLGAQDAVKRILLLFPRFDEDS